MPTFRSAGHAHMLKPGFNPLTGLLTVQPDYKLIGQILNESGVHEVESRSISQSPRSKSRPAHVLDGLAPQDQ